MNKQLAFELILAGIAIACAIYAMALAAGPAAP